MKCTLGRCRCTQPPRVSKSPPLRLFLVVLQSAPNSVVQLLIRRPRLNQGESLRGFALRIDSENSINLFRPRLGSFKEACMVLADIEGATGRSLKVLRQRVCLMPSQEATSAQVNVFGHRVPRAWIATQVRRVCPMCLNERGYMHANWEVHPIKSCLVHKCYLVRQCQACKSLLEWNRGGLFHCRCGANLCTMNVTHSARMRADLDLLISESLNSTIEGKADLWQAGLLGLLNRSGPSRFAEFAVIASHVAPRVGYAIALDDEVAKDEQWAELALRLIQLGRPGIEAALFGMLGNEMQGMTPQRRERLLHRNTHARKVEIQAGFNLNPDLRALSFVRDVLFPAWDEAHRRWLASVEVTLAGIEAQAIREAGRLGVEARNQRPVAVDARRAEEDARQATKDQELFEQVLRAYRNDSRRAKDLFWRRWDWFLERLARMP